MNYTPEVIIKQTKSQMLFLVDLTCLPTTQLSTLFASSLHQCVYGTTNHYVVTMQVYQMSDHKRPSLNHSNENYCIAGFFSQGL